MKPVMLAFLMKRGPDLEQVVVVTVDEDEAPGDDMLKIIHGHVLAMRKVPSKAHVTVCRPSEDCNS